MHTSNSGNNTLVYDVIVIGGGASGMMAALQAALNGASVALVEKNQRLGEKLRITGGGRCNILNAEENLRILLKNYGKAEQFLYSAFHRFGMQQTTDFFENLCLPLKVEGRKRAFPVSERASDVVEVLEDSLRLHRVTVIKGHAVTNIACSDGKITHLACGDKLLRAKTFVLSTGGTSHPETGSTGDGFGWLKKLGHSVKDPSPSITPLAVKDAWVKHLSGVTVRSISITFLVNNKRHFAVKGDVLFTHFGVSGPLILNNAYRVSELLELGKVIAIIDCYPTKDHKALDQEIVAILNENGNKLLKNTLSQFTPPGLAMALRELLETKVNFETKNSEVTKQARKYIVDTLKGLGFSIEKLMGLEKAVVADGGVHLSEIDTRTMKSKIVDNLFITGDLLDINRPSGGYSLQLCWTTGYIAGNEAAKSAMIEA